MRSIAAAVARELDSTPELVRLMQDGLANISAVSERVRQAIERELKTKTTGAAVGMAVRRYLNNLPAGRATQKPFPKHIELLTRSGIYELAVARNRRGEEIARRIRTELELDHADYLSIVEGSYEIVIFVSQRNKPRVRKFLGRTKPTSELDDVACVTVNWPVITKSIPGIYARITHALAKREVSIQSFHTVGAEMMIFVRQESLRAAHEVLERVLNNEL